MVGLVFVFAASTALGVREERRLRQSTSGSASSHASESGVCGSDASSRFFLVNVAITLVVLTTAMISGKLDPAITLVLETVIALMLNFPSLKAQQEKLWLTLRPPF